MRYTTIIDISVIPEIYRNRNATLLYLHLCLKSGYHDNNRDWYRRSIRGLAEETGLSFSATRHAIHMLEKYKLLTNKEGWWLVRKFVGEQKITPRKSKADKARETAVQERLKAQEQLERNLKETEEKAISYEEYLKQKKQSS